MKRLIALCSAALLLASCTKRINEGFGGTGDPVQVEIGFTVEDLQSAIEGQTKVYESEAMDVVFSGVDPDSVQPVTKASLALSNVWVIQFDAAGAFVTASKTATLAVNAALTPTLKAGKSQKIYVVAAMSDPTDFSTSLAGKTVADFKKMTATLGASPVMASSAGIPMCSDEITADIYSNGKFLSKTGIKLKRVVAQILFTARLGTVQANKYTITAVKLVNKAKNTYFAVADGATYPATGAANFEEKAATAAVTAQQNWLVPDNVRGTITNGDPLKKVPTAGMGECSYVEVKAERVAYGKKKEATMKIYLGSNMTDNFNIERNKIYTVTCTINDFEAAGDSRVEVTTVEAPVANCYMLVPSSATVTYVPVKRANEIYTNAIRDLYGLTNGTTYDAGTDAQVDYNGPTSTSWVAPSVTYNQADSLPEYADKRVWIAEIAWQDEQNGGQPLVTIENPIITNRRDLIRIKAQGAGAGNCVIRLRRVTKADGTAWDNQTVWTWHCWVTSYAPGNAASSREPGTVPGSSVAGTGNDGKAAVHTYAGWLNNDPGTEAISGGVKHPIMDRNLGAMSASPGVASYGLLYQWGRKDPFVGSRDGSNENGRTFYVPNYNNDLATRTISGWTSYNTVDGTVTGNTGKGDLAVRKVNAATLGNTIFSAIRNSGTFYFADVSPWDWTAPQNDALWQDAMKTLFDPCPVGWRVPRSGAGNLSPWSTFTLENGVWSGATDYTDPAAGRWFGGGRIWYGVTGGRSQGTGRTAWGQQWCHVWSSSLTETQYWILRFNATVIDEGGQTRAPAIGLSVRCIRE